MEDFAAAAAAVLDAEGVQQAVVAGHSFGGLVALRLARSRPELVRALLLVSPAGIATTTRVVHARRARVGDDPARPQGRALPSPVGRADVVPARALPAVVRLRRGRALGPGDARSPRRAEPARRHEDRGRAMLCGRPARAARRDLLPDARAVGSARRAVAARGRLRVRAAAAGEAPPRRRLRPPRDRRAAARRARRARGAGGVPRRGSRPG